jgi:hypothetical protein
MEVNVMKRIIFRSPFVTKRDRTIAKSFIETATTLTEAANVCIEKEDNINATKLIVAATKHWAIAAKRLGFRNIKDMDEYFERHGRF